MTWVDLKLDDGTVIQYYKKITPTEDIKKDKKNKDENEIIEVECVVLPDDYVSKNNFVLKTYDKHACLNQYNLPRQTITVA